MFNYLPWWARGGSTVDEIIEDTAVAARYVAAGAIAGIVIVKTLGTGTGAAPKAATTTIISLERFSNTAASILIGWLGYKSSTK